jgi:hypothetical protein
MYLATGISFRHLVFEFRMDESTVGVIFKYVCRNRIAHIVKKWTVFCSASGL